MLCVWLWRLCFSTVLSLEQQVRSARIKLRFVRGYSQSVCVRIIESCSATLMTSLDWKSCVSAELRRSRLSMGLSN